MAQKATIRITVIFLCIFVHGQTLANTLIETIAKIKPSIVAVGKYNPTSTPRAKVLGTGFAIMNGQYIATNLHVVPNNLNEQHQEKLIVFIGQGNKATSEFATVVAVDPEHDLAILKINDQTLHPLKLDDSQQYRAEGTYIAFTGFPIGSILGLYPVTHRGIVSALTPTAVPAPTSEQLNIARLKRLKNPFISYQLDATAYPGNSGSPLYDIKTGIVIAIINKVFVKESKENVLSDPSAITYAIPIKHLIDLIKLTNKNS